MTHLSTQRPTRSRQVRVSDLPQLRIGRGQGRLLVMSVETTRVGQPPDGRALELPVLTANLCPGPLERDPGGRNAQEGDVLGPVEALPAAPGQGPPGGHPRPAPGVRAPT